MDSTSTTSVTSSRRTRCVRPGRSTCIPNEPAADRSTCTWRSNSIPARCSPSKTTCSSFPKKPSHLPGFEFPLIFTWVLPPLPKGPDLLRLATDLAGVGGTGLPLEVSAIDSTVAVTDAPERTLSIAAKLELSLGDLFMHRENLCEVFDRCYEVSEFLLDRAPIWLDEV